ncbi:MAG: methionyl-tRNA formyltransferase [bacterium]|nr:methionyl-tRNA formyltransferase [bacterium]
MKNIKIVFMGTPDFSVPILEMLINNYNVVGVVTQPDKEVGRKKIITPSPVKIVAERNNINVLTPKKLKDEYESIIELEPDIIVTCAFGQLVPVEILNYPKYGCINVHASLLPKYRGGAPIQRAIMAGEVKTGITIMYMAEGLDTGDMISKEEVLIDDNDNYDSLSIKLQKSGVNLLEKTLPDILKGKVKREIQNNEESTYARIITRDDELIDFNKSTLEIHNKIRALDSIPGAYAILDGNVMKIYSSRMSDHMYLNAKNGQIVKIYSDGFGVSTKDSELIITQIQLQGKKRMSVKDYFNGITKEKLIGKVFNEDLYEDKKN